MLPESLIIYHTNCYVLALISGGGSLLGGGSCDPFEVLSKKKLAMCFVKDI